MIKRPKHVVLEFGITPRHWGLPLYLSVFPDGQWQLTFLCFYVCRDKNNKYAPGAPDVE